MDDNLISLRDVGRHLGITTVAVVRVVKRLGIEIRTLRTSASNDLTAHITQADFKRVSTEHLRLSESPGPGEPDDEDGVPRLPRATIYLYSKLPLCRSRGDLEDDVEALLGAEGECVGGGGGVGKPGWNLDFEIVDLDRLDFWMQRLVEFLREWGVPPDTYLDGWSGDDHRGRVEVFPTKQNAEPNGGGTA
jgi:hypothetical protein